MKYFKKILPLAFVLFVSVLSTPSFAFAADACVTGLKKDITALFTYLLCILDAGIIPILISVGLIIFIAGVVRFVGAGDNEEQRQGGRNMMIFGLIALFIMVSVWAFVNVLSNSFFGKNSEIQTLPKKSSTIYTP